MRSCPAAAVLLLACTLAACASTAPHADGQAAQRSRYTAYAGPPIDRFTWLGRYDSWNYLGNNQLVIFTTPSDAYLITVTPPCTDLPFVQGIGLTSTAGTVSARLDSVLVKGWRCQIAEIRQVDYSRMRADMKAEADKAKGGS